jgi:tetratricopeptide (TPR) repeat protein
MKAILSGQTAVAVTIEDEHLYSISLNSPDSWTPRQGWELPCLFAHASDILRLENVSRSEVIDKLKSEWAQDRCLQLILILLDPEEESQTRLEAAECVDEFLKQDEVRKYVQNYLYSSPLPSTASLNSAIQLSIDSSLAHLTEFLRTLQSDQKEISERCAAWEALPISLFDNPSSKQDFYYEAVRHGAFRLFVTERQKKNLAVIQLLSHPHFRGRSKARKIFQTWAAPFKESVTSIEFESQEIEDDTLNEADTKRKKRFISGFDALEQVDKQKEAIKKHLRDGKQDLALRFTKDLIASQRRDSEPEHIAKSLCDLAQFAKGLGSPELQLEFALKAVAEAPGDAWSYATLGDAYRSLGEFQKAQDGYHTAGVLGNVCIALDGRAEVLKDLGQLNEALQLYEQCIQKFPDDLVPRNGRAAALAYSGRLQQALDAYDEILRMTPYDVVTNCGRAQVLRDMGRLDEALKEFDDLARSYPEEIIPQNARAEVLRELGEMEEAKSALVNIVKHFPLASDARIAYARILRDLGKYPEALDEYNRIIREFPLNCWAYAGVAETYKKIGTLPQALEAYERVIKLFPRVLYFRNGKASVLVAMGDYSNALRILPTNSPATQSEWIAYHIQGMAQMRSGELGKAERIFEWGVNEIPWISQRAYFKTALATLRVQQKRYPEVFPLVQEIIHPSLEPIARALIMHASGELGDAPRFKQSYESIRNTSAPVVIELREALAGRYRQQTAIALPDSWFFLHECDSLLLAA